MLNSFFQNDPKFSLGKIFKKIPNFGTKKGLSLQMTTPNVRCMKFYFTINFFTIDCLFCAITFTK